MTKTEKMQAVHAGILIKAPVSSKDIFLYSVKQATEEGTSTLTTAKEVQKESYIATRASAVVAPSNLGQQGTLLGKNVLDLEAGNRPPPLRTQLTKDGVSRVAGMQGIRRKSTGPRHISGGHNQSAQDSAESFMLQTWEAADVSPEKLEVPETVSGGLGPREASMVTATLTTNGTNGLPPNLPPAPLSPALRAASTSQRSGAGSLWSAAGTANGSKTGPKKRKKRELEEGATVKAGILAEDERHKTEKAALIAKAFGE